MCLVCLCQQLLCGSILFFRFELLCQFGLTRIKHHMSVPVYSQCVRFRCFICSGSAEYAVTCSISVAFNAYMMYNAFNWTAATGLDRPDRAMYDYTCAGAGGLRHATPKVLMTHTFHCNRLCNSTSCFDFVEGVTVAEHSDQLVTAHHPAFVSQLCCIP